MLPHDTSLGAHGLHSSNKRTQFQGTETIAEAEISPVGTPATVIYVDSNYPTPILPRANRSAPATPGSIIYVGSDYPTPIIARAASAELGIVEPAPVGGLEPAPVDLGVGGCGDHQGVEPLADPMGEEQGNNGVRLGSPFEFWHGVELELGDPMPLHLALRESCVRCKA